MTDDKVTKLIHGLLEKFPEADEKIIRYFLTHRDPYIERKPVELIESDPERIEHLLDRFLHPADVF